ncbi:MAG: hypothetical protein WAS33_18940, partial [Candidatus Promineifilaceae bacterium]
MTNPTLAQLFRQRLTNLARLDRLGVPEDKIKQALRKTEMEGLPFIYGSFGIMFLVYAAIQQFLLNENGQAMMVAVAVGSGIFLLVGFFGLLRGMVPSKFAERATAVVATVILFTVL